MTDARKDSRLKDPAYTLELIADLPCTQQELCDRIGVGVSTLGDWKIQGIPSYPDQLALEVVCAAVRSEHEAKCKRAAETFEAITSEPWPDERRIDMIGHNGNTGEHYE